MHLELGEVAAALDFINTLKSVYMNELGGHPYFLINFFFYYNKSRSNLKVRLTTTLLLRCLHISQIFHSNAKIN